MSQPYDAVLIVSFGGPEGPEQVLPFLENVLRGKNVPRERMLAVAEHYYHFGGRSPINDQNRALDRRVEAELAATARRCRSIGAIAIGIRCCPIRWPKWAAAVCRRAGTLHQRLQFLFRLPAIPRKYRRCPARSSRSEARRRVRKRQDVLLEMVMHVKEPQPSEYPMIREG